MKIKLYMKNLKVAALLINIISSTALSTTLTEALVNTYQNNPELIAARENLKVTDEQMFEAISKFLPSIQYQYSYRRSKTDSQLAKVEWPDSVERIENGLDGSYTQTVKGSWRTVTSKANGFSLNQNIINGGQDAIGIQIAKYNIEAGRSQLLQTEQEIFYNAISAYFNVILNKQMLEINKENVNFYEQKLESVKHEIQAGVKKASDLAEAEASKANAQVRYVEAKGAYDSALATYAEIIGMPADNLTAGNLLFAVPKSKDDLLKSSLKNNYTIKYVEFSYKAANLAPKQNMAGMLPRVDVSASISKQRSIAEADSPYEPPYTNVKEIGATLTIPLYQKGIEYSQTRKATANASKIKYALRNTRSEVTQKVTQAWSGYTTYKESVVAAEEAVRAGKVALESISQGYDEGIHTITDLITAQENLYYYETNLAKAKNSFTLSIYNVASLMGSLDAKSLALPTKIYNPTANYDKIKLQLAGF